jgi:hypothetical protein
MELFLEKVMFENNVLGIRFFMGIWKQDSFLII